MVRVIGLPCDNVLEPVTVHIFHLDRVQLAEHDTVWIVFRTRANDIMPLKRYFASRPLLFKPCKTKIMGC